MAVPLNNFKTTMANLTTTTTTVYTPPIGYSTVVLMAQVSNNGANTVSVSAQINRSSSNTALITNAPIPTNDAIGVLTGRLILEPGDNLQFGANANSSAQLVLSYLETLIAGQ